MAARAASTAARAWVPSRSCPWAAAASKKVLTSDKLGRGVLVSRAASVTSRKSLRSSLIRKPGRKSPAMILGPRLFSCHDAAAPAPIASSVSAGSSPRRGPPKAAPQPLRLQVDRDGDLVDQLGHLAAAAQNITYK